MDIDTPEHPHLISGEFQSDKYPTCPRGKVPLSVKDKTAQDLLWQYAQRRRAVDAEFASDLEIALTAAGYVAPTNTEIRPPIHAAIPDGELGRSLEEIRNTPVTLLTEAEVDQLDADGQAWARMVRAKHAAEQACPKHERTPTSTGDMARRGDHRGHCKHCGMDMSYDSGD